MSRATSFETTALGMRPTMIDRRTPTAGDDIHQWNPTQGIDVLIEAAAPGAQGDNDRLVVDIDRVAGATLAIRGSSGSHSFLGDQGDDILKGGYGSATRRSATT